MNDLLRTKYSEASLAYGEREKQEERVLLYLSFLRLGCFAGGLVLVIWLFLSYGALLGTAGTLVIAILFLFLLKRWSFHTDRKEFFGSLRVINGNEAKAIDGDLSAFQPGTQYIDTGHDFSYDIDLFGNDSLFRYLNRTVTGFGSDCLAEWLSDPFPLSGDIQVRQQIVKELSGTTEWRQEFMAAGMKAPLDRQSISGLARWLEEHAPARHRKITGLLIWLLPAATLATLVMLIFGMVHYSVFSLMVIINLMYVSAGLKTTGRIHASVSGQFSYLSSMQRLTGVFAGRKFRSEHLESMRQQVTGPGLSATVAVKELGRIIQAFDSRLNFIAALGLNGLLLWDYHCIRRLERWKLRYRSEFPEWLRVLGRVDAFSSLGNFACNNPGFVFPVRSGKGILLSASMLGHPLISNDRRVCNDFRIEKSGSVCVVTGANMAGKSTFLRTVAVNFILAMTGCPVCARGLEFLPVKLFTSMRTTDSLAGNESYFYAELRRLRALKQKVEIGDPVFFILDEILKGTNSADKSLGSRLFLKKLVGHDATGLIATHDTSLGELEKEYPGKVFNKSFEIEIDGEEIRFDYRLYDGVTRKMNAALLMKQMGIIDQDAG